MICLHCNINSADSTELHFLTNGRAIHFSCLDEIKHFCDAHENEIQVELAKTNFIVQIISKKTKILNKYQSFFYTVYSFFRKANKKSKIEELTKQITELKDRKIESEVRIFDLRGRLNSKKYEQIKLLTDIYDFWPAYPPDWNNRKQNLLEYIDSCQVCEKHKRFLQVHHKIPLGKGGSNCEDNLMVLCRECHEKTHKTHFGTSQRSPSTSAIDKIKLINEAISANVLLDIKYIDYYGKKSSRNIKPLRIFKGFFEPLNQPKVRDDTKFDFTRSGSGHTYIEAFCYLDSEIRTFKVERIKGIKLLNPEN